MSNCEQTFSITSGLDKILRPQVAVQEYLSLIVENDSRRSISHLVAKPKFITVVDPFAYENGHFISVNFTAAIWNEKAETLQTHPSFSRNNYCEV